jgi:iron-sulfur cluster assembly accessory protein
METTDINISASAPVNTDGLILTDAAALKVKNLIDAEGEPDLALRVAVKPGGCAGFQYDLFFDNSKLDGDIVKEFSGVNVVVDRMSAEHINGAIIDFVDSINESGFKIENPNAAGGCGCGKSFC